MAWRNLWRRKRRTLITSATVAFGLIFSITVTGAKEYGFKKMVNTSASMGFGHVTVEPTGYNDSPTLEKKIADVEMMRTAVLGVPGVDSTAARIIGQAMFSSASKNVGGAFIAVDPAQESPATDLFMGSIIEGRLGSKDAAEAVVGNRLAEKLNLKIGKKLVYTTTGARGELVSDMARVTGIFKTGVDEVDGSMALLPIGRVRATLHYAPNEATILAVFITDRRNADKVRLAIEDKIGSKDREVLTWVKTQSELAGIMRVNRVINGMFQFFVWLIIAAGILDTILMSVLERKREFGVMMAVGTSPAFLFGLVLTESALVALLGLCGGLVVNAPLYSYLHDTGIDFSWFIPPGERYEAVGVPVDLVMKVEIYRESLAIILFSLFFLAAVSGLYPAFRASKVPPVESMKTI